MFLKTNQIAFKNKHTSYYYFNFKNIIILFILFIFILILPCCVSLVCLGTKIYLIVFETIPPPNIQCFTMFTLTKTHTHTHIYINLIEYSLHIIFIFILSLHFFLLFICFKLNGVINLFSIRYKWNYFQKKTF